MVEWAVSFVVYLMSHLISFVTKIFDVAGGSIWLGAAAFAIFFSVILIPLRGGFNVSFGGATDFAHQGWRNLNRSDKARSDNTNRSKSKKSHNHGD